MTLAICYILGSALFVIGSVLFLPAYFNDAAAPIFLAGSAFFMVGRDVIWSRCLHHNFSKESDAGCGNSTMPYQIS